MYLGAASSCGRRCSMGIRRPGDRLNGLGKLVYLIVAMMPMALVGAYLNRHATLFYPAYGPPARALGVSALDDQAQAGAIMWVVGGVVMTSSGCGRRWRRWWPRSAGWWRGRRELQRVRTPDRKAPA